MTTNCVSGPGIRGFNPVWSFVDLDGNQADDTFYLWVLENEIPYIPATVWHDPAMTIPWTNPIQFEGNGTLPIDIYFAPGVVYRLEIRKNDGTAPPSQADALIYLIENYAPLGTGDDPSDIGDSVTDNQITNPQFSIISFNSPYTLAATNPNPIEVAPGWFLDLTGTGTLTLERKPLNSALANPTNAPYALRIVLGGGWTSVYLRQRLQQNGMLWADQYVSNSITARIEGVTQQITARLDASDGQPLAILMNANLTNDFVEYTGNFLLGPTTNTNIPPNAYIDYRISLPTVSDIWITSIQLVSSSSEIDFHYEQTTINRQIDHTFNYYKPLLEYKPIPSYLVGWDFALNPAQWGDNTGPDLDVVGPIATGANGSFYGWDQTIIFQSVDNTAVVSREATSGGITITATGAACQIAIIQYIEKAQARELLRGHMSVALRAKCSDISQICTLSLWASAAALPDLKTPNFDSIVATLGTNGNVATQNGTWTELPRNNPGNAEFTMFVNVIKETSFVGWRDSTLTPHVDDVEFMAIVIGTSEIADGESVTFEWVSLNAGDIATRPAPQTPDQVYGEAQRYYWSTFSPGTPPQQNAGANTGYLNFPAGRAGGTNLNNVRFPSVMYAVPVITLYNPSNTNAQIRNFNTGADLSGSTSSNTNQKGTSVFGTADGGLTEGDLLGVHVSADSRLGII